MVMKLKKRLFIKKWRSIQEWLVSDPDKKRMYCTDCRTYGSEKVQEVCFVVGTSNEGSVGRVKALRLNRPSVTWLSLNGIVAVRGDANESSFSQNANKWKQHDINRKHLAK